MEKFPCFETDELESVRIFGSRISSLAGIRKYQIKRLSLEYNRRLNEVAEIAELQDSLEYLYIENCAKIVDFTFLKKLNNLKQLELRGSNKLESLDFINYMPNLEMFVFSMEVEDGDLTPCLKVPNAYCKKHRRNYNIRIKEY